MGTTATAVQSVGLMGAPEVLRMRQGCSPVRHISATKGTTLLLHILSICWYRGRSKSRRRPSSLSSCSRTATGTHRDRLTQRSYPARFCLHRTSADCTVMVPREAFGVIWNTRGRPSLCGTTMSTLEWNVRTRPSEIDSTLFTTVERWSGIGVLSLYTPQRPEPDATHMVVCRRIPDTHKK